VFPGPPLFDGLEFDEIIREVAPICDWLDETIVQNVNFFESGSGPCLMPVVYETMEQMRHGLSIPPNGDPNLRAVGRTGKLGVLTTPTPSLVLMPAAILPTQKQPMQT
jgi:hypothetical protein